MTAAALLVVLGAALLMQMVGMSMALGAFLAGVLLAESNYRHELEADIEPFRGLLLALFFMGVGMSDRHDDRVRESLADRRRRRSSSRCSRRRSSGLLFRATCAQPRRRAARRLGAHRRGRVRLRAAAARRLARHAERARRRSLLSAIAAITLLLGPLFATLTDALLRRLARRDRARGRRFRRRAAARCW